VLGSRHDVPVPAARSADLAKDGIKLCELEYGLGCLCRRNQSYRAVFAANRGPGGDYLGDTTAAEVRNTFQIQQEVLSAFGQKSLHRMSQRIFAYIESACNVQYHTSETIRDLMVTDMKSSYRL
jgi:hypothetical protein